ncbi:MAG: hypothetical protein IPH86_19030 [bacterium]|nr:hypothetical protein [bacterium]
MNRNRLMALTLMALALTFAASAPAQDLREAFRKAEQEREAVRARAAASEQAVLNDRTRLLAAVDSLESARTRLEAELKAAQVRVTASTARRDALEKEWGTRELDTREISGNVRLTARDLEIMLSESASRPSTRHAWPTASAPCWTRGTTRASTTSSAMASVILSEFDLNGRVALHKGEFIGRDSELTSGTIVSGRSPHPRMKCRKKRASSTGSPVRTFFILPRSCPAAASCPQPRQLPRRASPTSSRWICRAATPCARSPESAPRAVQTGGRGLAHPRGGPRGALHDHHRARHLNRIHANTDHFMTEVNNARPRAATGPWPTTWSPVTPSATCR